MNQLCRQLELVRERVEARIEHTEEAENKPPMIYLPLKDGHLPRKPYRVGAIQFYVPETDEGRD